MIVTSTSLLKPQLPDTVIYGYFYRSDDADLTALHGVCRRWRAHIDRMSQVWLNQVFEGIEDWYPCQSNSSQPYENGFWRYRKFRRFANSQLLQYEKNFPEAQEWKTLYGKRKNVVLTRELFVWLKNCALIDCYNSIASFPRLPQGTVDSVSRIANGKLWKTRKMGLNWKLIEKPYVPSLPVDVTTSATFHGLYFINCKLQFIPPRLGNVIALTELDFNSNLIDWLPNSLSKLTQLKVVNLSYNKLRELPPFVLSLPSLTELNLSVNSITEIPEGIGQLTQLKQLELDFNDLQRLPASIRALTNLVKLDCSGNALDETSEAIYKEVSAQIEDRHQFPPGSPERQESLSFSDTKQNPPFPSP